MNEQNKNHQTPHLRQTAVMRGAFEITINDGFCKWKFGLTPKEDGEQSIEDIMKVLWEHFESPEDCGEHIP
jgi:hypothetical protein